MKKMNGIKLRKRTENENQESTKMRKVKKNNQSFKITEEEEEVDSTEEDKEVVVTEWAEEEIKMAKIK